MLLKGVKTYLHSLFPCEMCANFKVSAKLVQKEFMGKREVDLKQSSHLSDPKAELLLAIQYASFLHAVSCFNRQKTPLHITSIYILKRGPVYNSTTSPYHV